MERYECPVCHRRVAGRGVGWTGWRAGLGDASGTALAVHGPRTGRCPGGEHVAAYVTPREATYTAVWVRQVGPVPAGARVEVFDFDPDGPKERGERVTDPGHVWLVLVDVHSAHAGTRVAGPVKVVEERAA